MKKEILLTILLISFIFITGCLNKVNSDGKMSNPYKDWPSEDYDKKCNVDSDCVSLDCQNIGRVIVHKNALNYLDEFKQKFCNPEINYEGVKCKVSWYYDHVCGINDENQVKQNDTSNLTQPGLPPDAKQPFSDDY